MKILYVRAYENGKVEIVREHTRHSYHPRNQTLCLLLAALEPCHSLLFNGGRQWFPLKPRGAR